MDGKDKAFIIWSMKTKQEKNLPQKTSWSLCFILFLSVAIIPASINNIEGVLMILHQSVTGYDL